MPRRKIERKTVRKSGSENGSEMIDHHGIVVLDNEAGAGHHAGDVARAVRGGVSINDDGIVIQIIVETVVPAETKNEGKKAIRADDVVAVEANKVDTARIVSFSKGRILLMSPH
jgi:hypothetical protein